MSVTKSTYDVAIIGGGPAGSTAGTFLAKKGYDVILFEKEKFPREHVGESLLPFCYRIFEDLGVLDELKARFVRKPGVRFVDSEGSRLTTWCFNHVIHDESFLSFQVTRSEFDEVLLNNSRANGVTVKEQTKVQDIELAHPDGMVHLEAVGPRGGKQPYRARFLLDASGRNAFMATKNNWRKTFDGLDRTAFWTHWDVDHLSGGLEEGLSLIVYLGGAKKGWIWVFPLTETRLTVGVVMNNQHIREERARLEANHSADWKQDLYLKELASSPFVMGILGDGQITSSLKVEGNYSYYVDKDKKFGKNFALIGDAGTFIDPIFSSGIFLSMRTSQIVSEALHLKLSTQNGEGDRALAEVYDRVNRAYSVVHRMIQLYYNPHAINFAEAGILARLDHVRHENAMAAGHYLLAGDFFDRPQHYEEFIALLENPKHFEKYKKVVIDRQDFQADTCRVEGYQIFPSNSRH